MHLYGREWSRRELEARVGGRIEQIGGIRRYKLSEGVEAGVEQIQIRTGAGLTYYVTPARGLDISLTEYAGAALSWQAVNGDVNPAYYDARGTEWLRTAAGGLLMTCGLTQAGSPCEDKGESLGLHGRVHHIPARQIAAEGQWVGDEYDMCVRGIVEEATIFGNFLRLTREIRSSLGDNRIRIKDVVENAGFAAAPHMLLYHFNFGFPLMMEETEIQFPSVGVEPREAGLPVDVIGKWQAPDAAMQEQVYFHRMPENEQVGAVIRNPRFPMPNGDSVPIEVRLKWHTGNLSKLVQWRMPGADVHALGIEPANCHVFGRADERAKGTLIMLQPGESLTYELELEVVRP